MTIKKRCAAAIGAALFVSASAHAVDIEFNFNFDGSGFTESQISIVESAFNSAAGLWEARLTDNIVVTVDAGFDVLGDNILASAGSTQQAVAYSAYRNALIADQTSNNDASAVANIPLDSISYLTNTLEADLVPDGDPEAEVETVTAESSSMQGASGSLTSHSHFSGCGHWDTMAADAQAQVMSAASSTHAFENLPLNNEEPPFEPEDTVISAPGITLDTATNSFFSSDNLNIEVNTANLKAVGLGDLVDPNQADAGITFNSSFFDSFDFDRTDGIDGQDFIAIAAHEIGHALGFVSGVDFTDIITGDGPFAQLAASIIFNQNPTLDSIAGFGVGTEFFSGAFINPLDLFRFSAASFNANGEFIGNDLTTGLFNPDVTFSIGNGNTVDLNATDICAAIIAGEFNSTVPYLSIDGGQTSIAPLSSGSFNGINAFASSQCTGQFSFSGANQASHFLETGIAPELLTLGLMDPQLANNLEFDPFATDLAALDVIGWDIAEAFRFDFVTPVSAPGTAGLILLGVGLVAARRKKKQA